MIEFYTNRFKSRVYKDALRAYYIPKETELKPLESECSPLMTILVLLPKLMMLAIWQAMTAFFLFKTDDNTSSRAQSEIGHLFRAVEIQASNRLILPTTIIN